MEAFGLGVSQLLSGGAQTTLHAGSRAPRNHRAWEIRQRLLEETSHLRQLFGLHPGRSADDNQNRSIQWRMGLCSLSGSPLASARGDTQFQ